MSELLIPDGGLLLHIGPQKTGTTAIQAALASARKSLGNDGGAYYPEGGLSAAQGRMGDRSPWRSIEHPRSALDSAC